MEKIASFTIDHLKLVPGVYVSRKDTIGKEVITTFDLRMTSPNDEPVMNTAEVHTIEHLAATYLRNDPEWKDRIATDAKGQLKAFLLQGQAQAFADAHGGKVLRFEAASNQALASR